MLPVFLWILTSGENYFSVSISFQTPAANAPPANGPRIKIQICSKAAPPCIMGTVLLIYRKNRPPDTFGTIPNESTTSLV